MDVKCNVYSSEICDSYGSEMSVLRFLVLMQFGIVCR